MANGWDASHGPTESSGTTASRGTDQDRVAEAMEPRAHHAGQDTATGCRTTEVMASSDGAAPSSFVRTLVHYDATHLITFGLGPPVGLIRTDRYVAAFLAGDPALDVRFVMFDTSIGGFRNLTHQEAVQLDCILFFNKKIGITAPEIDSKPAPEAVAPELSPPAAGQASVTTVPEPIIHAVTVRRLRTALVLPPPVFGRTLTQYAARLFPVSLQHSPARRMVTRAGRFIAIAGVRCGHFPAWLLVAAIRVVRDATRNLARPDPVLDPASIDEFTEPSQWTGSLPPEAEPEAEPERHSNIIQFDKGSILLSMGNTWDYMDYDYLHRICRDLQVRFVCVVYDVIAMQFPFATPFPPHAIHRHWIEIGHSAAHLLAISRFSVDQYTEFIAEPNGLTVKLSYAHLPNLPRDDANEIGEQPVNQLLNRRFVMFCSTIEIRKNHLLLMQLWDRLRFEFSSDELPILVFAGRWGWGTETIRVLYERNYRLRDRLLILDQVSDAELIWMYRHARFTLFPSLSEGYGLAAAESLAFGTPVVVANCPGLIEATEGLMPAYDPLDAMAWLREMRDLIRDERRLRQLRQAAALYQGPDHETFADAVRTVALAVANPMPLPPEDG